MTLQALLRKVIFHINHHVRLISGLYSIRCIFAASLISYSRSTITKHSPLQLISTNHHFNPTQQLTSTIYLFNSLLQFTATLASLTRRYNACLFDSSLQFTVMLTSSTHMTHRQINDLSLVMWHSGMCWSAMAVYDFCYAMRKLWSLKIFVIVLNITCQICSSMHQAN
jgi:hypothetical protein